MKIGRNDPCHCGSGKKYKRCCLSKDFVPKGKEDPIRENLFRVLLKYFGNNHWDSMEDAKLFFWDEFVPEEYLDENALYMAEINFMEWVVCDFIIDEQNSKTLIDLYLQSNKKLSLDEYNILMRIKHSVISLYEVQDVFPEKGLLLKDLLLGGEYDIREKSATRSLNKWDIIATRLLQIDGKYIMNGSIYTYNLREKDEMLEYIHEDLKKYQSFYPDAAMDDYLKKESEIFNHLWVEAYKNPFPMNLATTSGDAFVFSKAVFEIKDKNAAISKLKNIKEFEQDEYGFTWLDKGKSKMGFGSTILGNIQIKGNKLILECNSKKRLKKGKKLISKNTLGILIHKEDTFQDAMDTINSSLKENPSSEEKKVANKIPMEVQQKLYTQFMDKHFKKWLKEKIPALDWKTPLNSVETEEGRKKVIGLLKTIENREEYNKRDGYPFYDITWMWDKLGLARDE